MKNIHAPKDSPRYIRDLIAEVKRIGNAVNPGTTKVTTRDSEGNTTDIRLVKFGHNDYRLKFKTEEGWIETQGLAFTPVGTPSGSAAIAASAVQAVSFYKIEKKITYEDFAGSVELLTIPGGHTLADVIVLVDDKEDVFDAGQIELSYNGVVIANSSEIDLLIPGSAKIPVYKSYDASVVLEAELTGTPSQGEARIIAMVMV
jgi:hypothetical protein